MSGKSFFISTFGSFLKREIESSLQLLSCVSFRWSSIVNEFVRFYFSFDNCYSPWILSRFTHLTSLTLNNFNKSILVEAINNLTNLTTLIVPSDQWINDSALKNLTNLTKLKVDDGSNLSDEGISHLCKLNIFKIAECSKIRRGFKSLTNLTTLKAEIVGEEVTHLPNLTKLRFAQIADDCLNKLSNLTFLEVGFDIQLSKDAISNLTNLRVLYGGENDFAKNLTSLTTLLMISDESTNESFDRLTNLTYLAVKPNRNFSDCCFSHLVKLSELIIFESRNIFNKLDHLSNLTKLSLYADSIHDDVISTLTNLQYINLILNETITDNGLKYLTNLRRLELGGNASITYEGIKHLTNLISLNLADNANISNEELKTLTHLKKLDISFQSIECRFKNIGIQTLTNLITLKIYDNPYITRDGLKELTNLTKIDIRESEIVFEDIQHLTNLSTIICNPSTLSIWQKKNFPKLLRIIDYVF